MAMDDLCKCKHTRRQHFGTACNWQGQTSVDANGMNPVVTTCTCKGFDDLYAVPDLDNADDIGGFLENLRMEMAAMSAAFAPLKQVHEEAKAEIEAIELQRRVAVEKAKSVETQMRDFELMLRKAEQAAEIAQRRKDQADALREADLELKRMADEFDRITMGAPWREWAFDYQMQDAKVMALGKRVLVGNTMGTGKTLTSLIAVDMLKSERVLIFTPATVMRSYVAEVKRWAPHRAVFLIGGMNKVERRAAINLMVMMKQAGQGFTIILNYEAMRKDSAFIDDLRELEFETVILDEAHNFKDKTSLTFRQVKQVCEGIPNVFPMTGSPILNKPQDLWPLLYLIDPYQFYDEYAFLSAYCRQNYDTGKWEFSPTGLKGLQAKLRNKFLRRTKEQTGISLPSKTIQVHDIVLDPLTHPKQYAAARSLSEQAAIFLEDGRAGSITTVLALITRKRQMMTLPTQIKWIVKDEDDNEEILFQCDVDESVKLDYIIHANGDAINPTWDDAAGLLPEIVQDEKVVIFSQFKQPLHELKRRCALAGIKAEIIDGDVAMQRRQDIIDDFQNPMGATQVILGNFKALGVGVTLTAATQMIILDEEWNPGKNEQAYDRIHRIGQEKPVTIHVLRVENSVDGWMADINEQKAALVDGFNSTMDLSQDLLKKMKDGML